DTSDPTALSWRLKGFTAVKLTCGVDRSTQPAALTRRYRHMIRHPIRSRALFVAGTVSLLVLAGCSSGGGGGSNTTEIDFLVENGADTVAAGAALVEAFNAENADISVTLETRPGGPEGANVVKTRLSTDEMADVFIFNTGSLFETLNPDETLVEMGDQSWSGDLDEQFVDTV